MFSTATDNQPGVDIHVLQGEREFASANKTLGRFSLTDIPPAPRGVPQIEVTFDIDANGIVHVSAKDLGTGKEQSVTITSSSNLKEEEIDKAVKEAEKYAEEDKKRREVVDARNQAEAMAFALEKTLRDNGDKISEEEKKTLTDAIAKAREEFKKEDKESIDKALEELTKVSEPIMTKLYQNVNPNQNAQNGQGPEVDVKPDDIKDAN